MATTPNNLSSSTGSLIDAVGHALEEIDTGIDEKKELDSEIGKASMQHEIQMATIGLQEMQAGFSDNASARENQSRVQEAEHASWMAKNVHSILAVGIIGLTFFMYWYIAFSDQSTQKLMAPDSPMKDIVIYILGALTTVATQVVSYYFGSSTGSADKSKAINSKILKG